MRSFAKIKTHLVDNTGDENVSKLIWIVIAFVVGGILFGIMQSAFGNQIKTWLETSLNSYFPSSGDLRPAAPSEPITQ